MKKQNALFSTLILFNIALSGCGSGGARNQQPESAAETSTAAPPPVSKGIVFVETHGVLKSLPVSEKQIVVSDQSIVHFQSLGDPGKVRITPATHRSESVTFGGIEYFFVPSVLHLKKIKTTEQVETRANTQFLGQFVIQESDEESRIKLKQNSLGSLQLLKTRTRFTYSADGKVRRYPESRREDLKSTLGIELNQDQKTFNLFANLDKDEINSLRVRKEPEGSEPQSFQHIPCVSFSFAEPPKISGEELFINPWLSYIPKQEVSCDNLLGTCDPLVGYVVVGKSITHRLPISQVWKLPRTTCNDPGLPPDFEQTITTGVKLLPNAELNSIQLMPAGISESANTQLLFQEIKIDEDVNF